jgi:hypothetical protein
MKLCLSLLLALPLLLGPVVPAAMAADAELVLQGGKVYPSPTHHQERKNHLHQRWQNAVVRNLIPCTLHSGSEAFHSSA